MSVNKFQFYRQSYPRLRKIQRIYRKTKYEKNWETQYGQDFVADYVQYLNIKAPDK